MSARKWKHAYVQLSRLENITISDRDMDLEEWNLG